MVTFQDIHEGPGDDDWGTGVRGMVAPMGCPPKVNNLIKRAGKGSLGTYLKFTSARELSHLSLFGLGFLKL